MLMVESSLHTMIPGWNFLLGWEAILDYINS